MVNYKCLIFRYATQTFNGGYKSKINRYKMNLVLKIVLIQGLPTIWLTLTGLSL